MGASARDYYNSSVLQVSSTVLQNFYQFYYQKNLDVQQNTLSLAGCGRGSEVPLVVADLVSPQLYGSRRGMVKSVSLVY